MNTTQSHDYDNLSFDITKYDDSVMITCIDKVTRKSYRVIFDRGYIVDVLLLHNVNNCYDVLNNAFEKKDFTINTDHDVIDVHIQTTISLITFDINFSLRLMEQTELSTTYIEKLHKKIKRLEDIVNNQQVFIAHTTHAGIVFCSNVLNNVIIVLPPKDLRCPNGDIYRDDVKNICGNIVFDDRRKELTISLGLMYGRFGGVVQLYLLPSLHTVRTKRMTFMDGVDETKLDMSIYPVLYEEDEF